MARDPDQLFSTADVISVDTEDGEVRLKLGDAIKAIGIASEVPCYGPDGFIGIPNAPDEDGAAQALYIQDGDGLTCLGTRDNRLASQIGAGEEGDRMIVGKVARVLVKKKTASVTLYTEGEKSGFSQLISNDGSKEKITLAVGLTKIEITADDIKLSVNGGPALSLSKLTQSAEIRGNNVNIDGGRVTVGLSSTGIRPAVPGVQSALVGPLGILGLPSPTVLIANT